MFPPQFWRYKSCCEEESKTLDELPETRSVLSGHGECYYLGPASFGLETHHANLLPMDHYGEIEVIGNIFEHPHLLKDGVG